MLLISSALRAKQHSEDHIFIAQSFEFPYIFINNESTEAS